MPVPRAPALRSFLAKLLLHRLPAAQVLEDAALSARYAHAVPQAVLGRNGIDGLVQDVIDLLEIVEPLEIEAADPDVVTEGEKRISLETLRMQLANTVEGHQAVSRENAELVRKLREAHEEAARNSAWTHDEIAKRVEAGVREVQGKEAALRVKLAALEKRDADRTTMLSTIKHDERSASDVLRKLSRERTAGGRAKRARTLRCYLAQIRRVAGLP